MISNKECLVIPRSKLTEANIIPEDCEGRYIYKRLPALSELKKVISLARYHGEYKPRFGNNGMENNPDFQQLVMYGFVVTQEDNFLIYRRGKGEEYLEDRLAGKVSLGIGGHMDRTDLSIGQSFYRELEEEAEIVFNGDPINFRVDNRVAIREIKKIIKVTPVGVIKDERDNVGKVHLGIVCRITLKIDNLEIKVRTETGENVRYQYVTPQQYLAMKESGEIEPEGWTDIIFREEILPT